jgi:hypothetical protein
MRVELRIAFLLLLSVMVAAACGKAADGADPQAVKLQSGDIKKLAWIEGTWRGTGGGIPPFFERYRFDGDQALVMEGFSDEALTKQSETTRYEIKNGVLGNGRSAATELTDTSVSFAPVDGKGNPFKWISKGKDSWTAVLDVPARGGKPASQVVYQLERWTPPAAPVK